MTSGQLHLIIGPMYSSKTTTLIGKYYTYRLKYDCVLINNSLDTRYDSSSSIVTHNKLKENAIILNKLSDIDPDVYNKNKVLLIDEGQFFDDLKQFTLKAVEKDNKIIVIAGLNGDSNRENFGQIIDLIPYNDTLTFLTGICHFCKDIIPSLFSLRLNPNNSKILVGSSDNYVSVCRKHYLIYKKLPVMI